MANLKVFVSSTCYDLNVVRSQLRNFILNFGYEPVMSDYSDVLYDPRVHTHTSCVQEVNNCDLLIILIGSRFGGKAIPKALELVDIDSIKGLSSSTKFLEDLQNISITQLEVIKAIESNIPIFTFVDNRVMHDHLVYEKNKEKKFLDEISFPSFADKPEVAQYVFEFINFIRHRIENNSITGFAKMEDIETYLRKQWSGLFQRLLYEQRFKKSEGRKMDYLANQIADIKTAIMTSLSTSDLKETARGAIKFRRLIQFISQLRSPNIMGLLLSELSWGQLMEELNIIDFVPNTHEPMYSGRTTIVLRDGTFYESRLHLGIIERLRIHWEEFIRLNPEARQAIINAVMDNEASPMLMIKYIPEQFSEVAATKPLILDLDEEVPEEQS